MLQCERAWHLEQVYEFTTKLRTNKLMLNKFTKEFQDYNSEKNDIKKKIEWLMDFINKSKYVGALLISKLLLFS